MPKTNRKPGIHLHKTEARRVLTPTTPDYYPAEWYWILIARNGKTIAKSSETYKTKRAAVRSIVVAADIISGLPPVEYFDHTGKDGVKVVEF